MEGGHFKTSLGYMVRPCLYKKKGEGGKEGGRKEREGRGNWWGEQRSHHQGKLGIRNFGILHSILTKCRRVCSAREPFHQGAGCFHCTSEPPSEAK